MDPVSRRRLWQEIINLTRRRSHSVLLTSHSMEECEVLCTRLAIMVDGKFKCMGSVQHLKARFGDGYTLTVKTKEMPEYIESDNDEKQMHLNACSNKYINLILKELKQKISPNCSLKERHFNNVYQFEIPSPYTQNFSTADKAAPATAIVKFNIGDIYRLIELNKLKFNLVDYSLTQNTLDNVFINFIKEQTNKKKNNRSNRTDTSSSDSNDDVNNDESTSGTGNGVLNKSFKQKSNIQFPIDDNDELLLDIEQDFSIKNRSNSKSKNKTVFKEPSLKLTGENCLDEIESLERSSPSSVNNLNANVS
jgi:ABC-type proline/glycine betaine transport system ATPase subunit